MTTPSGTPSGANPARPRGYSHEDVAAQANPTGGGQFKGGGEAKVIGTNQDTSATGASDAASATSKMKQGYSNAPGVNQFTPDN